MKNLKIEIENLESFVNNSNMPTNEEAWYEFCQSLEDHISNINSEFDYYENEMKEKDKEIETLNDRLTALRERRTNAKVPLLIKSDRKNWCDFDKVFD